MIDRADIIRAIQAVRAQTLKHVTSRKTEVHYQRVLDRNVRDLYKNRMGREEFINDQVNLIDEQFTRAWNEGMRRNGLDPEVDMTPQMAKELDDTKLRELDFIEKYADDIIRASANGDDIQTLRDRVELWSNRYTQVVEQAKDMAAADRPGFADRSTYHR